MSILDSTKGALAAPEMPDHFGFGLDESAALCKRWLENFGVNTIEWDAVVNHWKKAKAHLIDALDPKTGRAAVKVDHAKTLDSLHEAMKLHGNGHLVGLFSETDVKEGEKVSPGSKIIGRYPEVKEGEKISRAIVKATIKNSGCSEKCASDLAARIMDSWQAGTKGYLVLSANIADILMSSWHAAFKSCHRPEGESSGGPQQYLADDQTLVGYFYGEHRPEEVTGTLMPYKTWRQLVHIDLRNKGAIFMREYGTTPADATHKVLRSMAGRLVIDLAKVEGDDPSWFVRRNKDECTVTFHNSTSGPAYPDEWRNLIAVGSGREFEVTFAKSIPCPSCGECQPHNRWPKGRLYHCRGMLPCVNCQKRMPEGDLYRVKSGDTSGYCKACFESMFSHCDMCGLNVDRKTITKVDGIGNCCHACFTKFIRKCNTCYLFVTTDQAMLPYPDGSCLCKKCGLNYHSCSLCARRTDKVSTHTHKRHGETAAKKFLVCDLCAHSFHACKSCGEERYRGRPENARCESCAANVGEVPQAADERHVPVPVG